MTGQCKSLWLLYEEMVLKRQTLTEAQHWYLELTFWAGMQAFANSLPLWIKAAEAEGRSAEDVVREVEDEFKEFRNFVTSKSAEFKARAEREKQ